MKLLIASDIHGAAGYCRDLLAAWDREGADRLLLLGDLLYHGPRNDLPPDYAPKEVIALLNARKNQIFCVRGNCDTEVDQMVLEFPVLADYAVLTAGSRLLYATHGHVYNTAHLPPLQPGDILLHGHTHIPAWEVFGTDNLYLNPGSVSIPKAGTPHRYMTLENGVFTWKELGGVPYTDLIIYMPRGRGRACPALHLPIDARCALHARAGHARPLPPMQSITRHPVGRPVPGHRGTP